MTSANLSTDSKSTVQRLVELQANLEETVRKARRRNGRFMVFAVIMVIFLVGYLGYAYHRFGNEVTPDLVATNAQAGLESTLPQARAALEENLKANAPLFVDSAVEQLNLVPARFAESVSAEAAKHMDEAMPKIEQGLYASLKTAINDAGKPKSTETDEQRFQSLLTTLATVYGTETIKFIDDLHRTYTSQADDVTAYLDRLAQNDKLNRREQLHREMFQSMFTIVRARDPQSFKAVN